jgi:hypothetical protein
MTKAQAPKQISRKLAVRRPVSTVEDTEPIPCADRNDVIANGRTAEVTMMQDKALDPKMLFGWARTNAVAVKGFQDMGKPGLAFTTYLVGVVARIVALAVIANQIPSIHVPWLG